MSSNKFLQAAAGTAAAGGAGALNVEDVFSTYLWDGNNSTQIIDNGVNLGQSNDGGSISLEAQADGLEIAQSSDFNFGTGDFTCEAWIWLNDSNTTYRTMFGFDVTGGLLFQVWNMQLDLGLRGTSSTVSNGSLSANQWNHLAVVRSSGTVYLFINGTLDKTATVDGASNSWSTINLSNSSTALIGDYSKNATNFNGRISNLRVSNTARYTATFTVPTSALSSDANTVLLIGQNDDPFADQSSSSHSALPYGLPSKSGFGPFDAADAGEGGLVWTKTRNASYKHALFDTERGTTNSLSTNSTAAQVTETGVTSFNSSGFTIGSWAGINQTGKEVVSWTFRKAPKFFDCIQYSGTGTTGLVLNHDLGCEVGTVIIKRTDTTNNWYVHHRSVGGTQHLILDGVGAATSYGGTELTTSTTSITINMANNITNASGGTYVAYLFAHNNGDGEFGSTADQDIIKCGSYTETANGSDTLEDLGFEPQFVLLKPASTTGNWELHDVMRGMTVGSSGSVKQIANVADQDVSQSGYLHPQPNGFIRPDGYWGVGNEIIYIAIRRGPMAVPTDATDVFNVHDEVGEPSTSPLYLGNTDVIDMVLSRNRYKAGGYNYITDRLRGSGTISYTDNTNAETSGLTYIEFDHNTNNYIAAGGYGNNSGGTSEDSVFWQWKRAPNFFDVVAYTGNGTAGRTVSHNLGVAPEMMWVKCLSNTYSWSVYHKGCNGGVNPEQYRLVLNDTFAETANSTRWNDTAPTESVFTLGTATQGNASGENYIAYLFASLDGVSKVGSVNHVNGTRSIVNCGFSNGARFVLFKYADSSTGLGAAPANWHVFDTKRGIIGGIDARLSLNTTDAEINTGNDYIDPDSSGFSLPSSHPSGTYVFYAIA